MRSKLSLFVYVILAVAIVAVVVGRLRTSTSPSPSQGDLAAPSDGEVTSRPSNTNERGSPSGIDEHAAAEAVESEETTSKPGEQESAEDADEATELPGPLDYGNIKPVPGDANKLVAQAIEAMKTGRNPERLSPLIAPQKFDPTNVDDYVNSIAPGRCFQVADPGPTVQQLRHGGPRAMRARQDQTVVLRARAVPGAPVTFTSMHAGFFEASLLPTITVAADKAGVAEAKYKPGPGVTNDVRIVAGSPLCSGTIRYLVVVEPVRTASAPKPSEEATR